MEREIKFRKWHKELNDMTFFDSNDKNENLFWYFFTNYPDMYILMQYTGLKDKNGKEIYEGDICFLIGTEEWEDKKEMLGIRKVVWSNLDCSFYYYPFIPINFGGFKSVEVIGNIYENPELINPTK